MADLFDVVVARKLSGGGGGSWQTVFEDDVETLYSDKSGYNSGVMSLDTALPETIKVTFNEVEYICNRNDNNSYGAVYAFPIDFSEYPFSIQNSELYVQGEDTTVNSVKIEVLQSGGSSDFSTAEVTIINGEGNSMLLDSPSAPNCVEQGVLGEGAPAMVHPVVSEEISGGASITITVPLYKGGCFWVLSDARSYATTGNIVEVYEGAFLITGDCTITITISSGGSSPK